MDNNQEYESLVTPSYWHVVFVGRPFRHWFDIFSPSWARHVFAYAYLLKYDKWVIVDPLHNKTAIMMLDNPDMDAYLDTIEAVGTKIYTVAAEEGSVYSGRLLQTCSSVVLRIIGLKGSACTPRGLIKILERNNAKVRTIKP